MLHPPMHRAIWLGATATALALGLAATASAAEKESRLCRTFIGNEAVKVIQGGLKSADLCHKAKDKVCTGPPMGSDRENCNVIGAPGSDFDPKGKYASQKTKSADKLQGAKGKCLAGDPVLLNYPAGDIDASVFPFVDAEVSGSSALVQGEADLLCDTVKKKCLQTIGKARTDIIKEIVRDAVKCQKAIDKVGTIFGKLDPTCLANPADKSAPKATAKVQKDCVDKGLTGTDVGSCETLPGCVVDAAVQTGLGLAPAIYSQIGAVCGNSLIEGGEQCDDGNATSGDGCSAACETEGLTCNVDYAGFGAVDGTRQVIISIDTPEPLGGIELGLDYPQFQSGIPGTGNSSLVNSRFSALQTAGLAAMNDSENDVKIAMVDLSAGFSSGNLAQVDFDNCVGISQKICNRNQNIFGCSGSDAPPSCGTAPPAGQLGTCSTSGGCPGDNFCEFQTNVMGCTVSNPTDLLGQPVAGVTCSVTITEIGSPSGAFVDGNPAF